MALAGIINDTLLILLVLCYWEAYYALLIVWEKPDTDISFRLTKSWKHPTLLISFSPSKLLCSFLCSMNTCSECIISNLFSSISSYFLFAKNILIMSSTLTDSLSLLNSASLLLTISNCSCLCSTSTITSFISNSCPFNSICLSVNRSCLLNLNSVIPSLQRVIPFNAVF